MSELLAKLLSSDDALLDGVGANHPVPAHLRSAAQKALESSGFPHLKTEAWKYTSLRRVEAWDFQPDVVDHTAVKLALDEYFSGQLPQYFLVFAGGQFLADLSRAGDSPPLHNAALSNSLAKVIARQRHSEDAFVNLCVATSPQAWSIELQQNKNEPLHLVYLPAQPGQASNRSTLDQLYLHFSVADREKCSVIEHFLHDAQGLSNYCTHIELGEGAQLSHGRRVLNSDQAAQIGRTELEVSANARYELAESIHDGMLVRHEARVYFYGANGHASVSSAARLTGKARLDQDWLMIHEADHCKTEQNFRAAVDDHSSASFTGRAKITERIAGSVVYQSSKGLMLSPDAAVNARPVLEIHADEVQASHGATVGCLDEAAWHYLRARGVPVDQARNMLIDSFVLGAFENFTDTELKDVLTVGLSNYQAEETLV